MEKEYSIAMRQIRNRVIKENMLNTTFDNYYFMIDENSGNLIIVKKNESMAKF